MQVDHKETLNAKQISRWLTWILVLVIVMIALGAITRLTRSGLSIVEWKPIIGILPPLNHSEWQQEFSLYQNFPEYKKLNYDMTLDDFKGIYFWEYIHRLLGRIIGLVIFLPLVVFIGQRKISGRTANRIFWLLILGGLQGYIGWIMVKSGLEDHPHVSHYKLAMHLGMAMLVIMYLVYLINSLKSVLPQQSLFKKESGIGAIVTSWSIVFFVQLQIFYGALVAGLKAGYSYSTFPLMNGQWIPDGVWNLSPLWINFFENHALVQWIHRVLGIGLALLIFIFAAVIEFSSYDFEIKKIVRLLGVLISVQVTLGILTLIFMVPVSVATIHQIFGVFTLIVSFYLALQLTPTRTTHFNYLYKS